MCSYAIHIVERIKQLICLGREDSKMIFPNTYDMYSTLTLTKVMGMIMIWLIESKNPFSLSLSHTHTHTQYMDCIMRRIMLKGEQTYTRKLSGSKSQIRRCILIWMQNGREPRYCSAYTHTVCLYLHFCSLFWLCVCLSLFSLVSLCLSLQFRKIARNALNAYVDAIHISLLAAASKKWIIHLILTPCNTP